MRSGENGIVMVTGGVWRETSLLPERLTGEYVSATEKINMYREVSMKFLFYNSMIKYDATGELPWVKT